MSDTIYVEDEGEGLMLEFRGPDAEARHDRWALAGEPTYDASTPI